MRWTALALMGCVATAWIGGPALAQFGPSLMRVQTRTIERAVSRNLDRVFRPKLVVAKGATGPVTALALSRDERLLITAVGNNTVRVWDLWAGREVARLSGHKGRINAVSISRDGRKAVTVADDRSVRAWDLSDYGQVVTLGEHAAAVTDVALAGDSSRVFSAAADGTIRVSSLRDGSVEREFQGHAAGIVRLAATSDGKRLVSVGADRRARIWDVSSGRMLSEMDTGGTALSVALSADDGRVAVGTGRGEIKLWRLNGETPDTLDTDSDDILSVAFTADGQTVLAGSADGSVVMLSLADHRARLLGKHESRVSYVAASTDNAFVLSGSEDGTSRLWNVASGAQLLSLISTETGWAVVDQKGRYDGNQQALSGIEWQAGDDNANIEDFAESHYQAALLPRVMQGDDVADAASIPDGVKYPPSVRFLSPSEGQGNTRNVVVEVVAEDNGGGVAEVRLYRNGKLLPRSAGNFERQEKDGAVTMRARYDVELTAGANVLSATAVNEQRLESRPRSITVGEGGAPKGKLHILTVGINRYAQSKLNLDYARPDAESIAAFLSSGGHTPIPVAQTISLNDEQATRENILAALRQMRSVPPEDSVVVYMAGHGVSVGDEWYYITHEVQIPDRPSKLAGLALSSDELKAEVEAISADRTLLLLDTCHSGTAVSPLRDYRGLKSLRLLARTVGTHILAATDRNQFAVELEALGHGIFTYTVLAALNGEGDKSADGRVSAVELIHFVEEKVPSLSKKFADYAQYPTGYSRGTDFVVSNR